MAPRKQKKSKNTVIIDNYSRQSSIAISEISTSSSTRRSARPRKEVRYEEPETQTQPVTQVVTSEEGEQIDDRDRWWEIDCILAEKGHRYKARWLGVSKDTGKPYKDEWLLKTDVTRGAEEAWEAKQAIHSKSRKRKRPVVDDDDKQVAEKEPVQSAKERDPGWVKVSKDDACRSASGRRELKKRRKSRKPFSQLSSYQPTQAVSPAEPANSATLELEGSVSESERIQPDRCRSLAVVLIPTKPTTENSTPYERITSSQFSPPASPFARKTSRVADTYELPSSLELGTFNEDWQSQNLFSSPRIEDLLSPVKSQGPIVRTEVPDSQKLTPSTQVSVEQDPIVSSSQAEQILETPAKLRPQHHDISFLNTIIEAADSGSQASIFETVLGNSGSARVGFEHIQEDLNQYLDFEAKGQLIEPIVDDETSSSVKELEGSIRNTPASRTREENETPLDRLPAETVSFSYLSDAIDRHSRLEFEEGVCPSPSGSGSSSFKLAQEEVESLRIPDSVEESFSQESSRHTSLKSSQGLFVSQKSLSSIEARQVSDSQTEFFTRGIFSESQDAQIVDDNFAASSESQGQGGANLETFNTQLFQYQVHEELQPEQDTAGALLEVEAAIQTWPSNEIQVVLTATNIAIDDDAGHRDSTRSTRSSPEKSHLAFPPLSGSISLVSQLQHVQTDQEQASSKSLSSTSEMNSVPNFVGDIVLQPQASEALAHLPKSEVPIRSPQGNSASPSQLIQSPIALKDLEEFRARNQTQEALIANLASSIAPELMPVPQSIAGELKTPEAFDETLQALMNSQAMNLVQPYIRQLSKDEHVLAVPMTPHQIALYSQVVMNNYKAIEKYFSAGNSQFEGSQSSVSLDLIERCRRDMESFATHPDLGNDITLPAASNPAACAWMLSESCKFVVIKAILDGIRNEKADVVIVAKDGKLMDMLEILMKSYNFSYSRTGNDLDGASEHSMSHDNLRVTLLPSGIENRSLLAGSANLVIALDSTVEVTRPQIERLRVHSLEPGTRTPIIRLMTLNTLEHVDLCISREVIEDSHRHLNALMFASVYLKREIGKLTHRLQQQYDDFVKKDFKKWLHGTVNLLPPPPVKVRKDASPEAESGIRKRVHSISLAGGSPSLTDGTPRIVISPKRQRLDPLERPIDEEIQNMTQALDVDMPDVKEPVVEENVESENVVELVNAPVRDVADVVPMTIALIDPIVSMASIADVHAVQAATIEEAPAVLSAPAQVPNIDTNINTIIAEDVTMAEPARTSTPDTPPKSVIAEDPESAAQDMNVTSPESGNMKDIDMDESPRDDFHYFVEELLSLPSLELIDIIKHKTKEHEEWVAQTGELQKRVDDYRAEIRDLRKDVSEKTTVIVRRNSDNQKQRNRIEALINERDTMKKGLEQARSDLLGGPDAVERFELGRAEIQQAKERIEMLEKRIALQTGDLDFMRERYQDASHAASELSNSIDELKVQNHELMRQSDDTRIRLANMNIAEERRQNQERIKHLEAVIAERDEHIRRLDADKERSKRARGLGTRASSVPRHRGETPTSSSRGASPNPNNGLFLAAHIHKFTKDRY